MAFPLAPTLGTRWPGPSCASISGATDRSGYVLKSADVGNTVGSVEATNADGNTFATSAPTAVIAAATNPTPVSNGCAKLTGTILVADVSPPARLTIDQTQVEPSSITYGTRSLTARFHVSACGGPVEGALVYVTAVPYGQFSAPNEQLTGVVAARGIDERKRRPTASGPDATSAS